MLHVRDLQQAQDSLISKAQGLYFTYFCDCQKILMFMGEVTLLFLSNRESFAYEMNPTKYKQKDSPNLAEYACLVAWIEYQWLGPIPLLELNSLSTTNIPG